MNPDLGCPVIGCLLLTQICCLTLVSKKTFLWCGKLCIVQLLLFVSLHTQYIGIKYSFLSIKHLF